MAENSGMKVSEMEVWWCARCDFTLECLAATEVRCRKGHRMKKYTDRELEMARRAEAPA